MFDQRSQISFLPNISLYWNLGTGFSLHQGSTVKSSLKVRDFKMGFCVPFSRKQ
jgi:hypothetical protein